MKSFGSGKNKCDRVAKLPNDHPVLTNTDYEKRLREFDKAFDHMAREIERRDELIRNLSKDETTSTSIDVSLIRQIINEEIKESTGAMSPKSERIERSERNEMNREEREEFAQTLKEQNESLSKIQNDVTLFEDILKNKMNASQRDPAYLKTTKAVECRKASVNDGKKKQGADRWR